MIEPIKAKQYKNISELYRKIAAEYNTVLSESSFNTLERSILYSDSTLPKAGNYFVQDKFDLASFNTEIGMINSDYRVLSEFLEEYISEVSDIKYISNMWYMFIKKLLNSSKHGLSELNEISFIEGRTKIINFNSDIIESDNITIDNNKIRITSIDSINDVYIVNSNDISVKPIGTEKLTSKFKINILGKPESVFNNLTDGILNLELVVPENKELGFAIESNVYYKNINTIEINFGVQVNQVKVILEISSDSKEYKNVIETIANGTHIIARFDNQDITKVKLTMLRDLPNINSGGNIKYTYAINSLKFINEVLNNNSYFITNKIVLDKDTESCVVVTDEYNNNCQIDYYVSTTEIDGKPAAFNTIKPNDKKYKVLFDGIKSRLYVLSKTPEWSINSEIIYGNKLYNILDSNNNTTSSEVAVISNKLVPSPGFELVEDKIKIYRGINDYIIKDEYIVDNINNEDIFHKVNSDDNGWITKIPILFRSSIRITVADFVLNTETSRYDIIKLNLEIHNPSNCEFIRDDGEIIKPQLIESEYEDGTELMFDFGFDVTHTYNMLCDIGVYEYCQKYSYQFNIIVNTISVKSNSNSLVSGKDYLYDNNTFKFELLKGGVFSESLTSNSSAGVISNTESHSFPPLVISYSCTLRSNRPKKYYETNIYVEKTSNLKIKSFSDTEISAGNFHIIDNVNVSRINTYKITSGWHVLKTTQPYSCLPGREVNMYTNKESSAGIIFPDDIDIVRAYKDSLRKVNLFELTTMPLYKSYECFSYDNGKIYITFMPDFISSKELTSSNRLIHNGNYFTCRKPVYDSSFNIISYEAYPEQLMVDVSLKNENYDKFIYIKGSINRSSNGELNINRIGINTSKNEAI